MTSERAKQLRRGCRPPSSHTAIVVGMQGIPEDVARKLWGDEATQRKRFAAAVAEQKRRRAREERTIAQRPGLSLHDDRLYTGYDIGLGCRLDGRAHRREVMRLANAVEG